MRNSSYLKLKAVLFLAFSLLLAACIDLVGSREIRCNIRDCECREELY
jgi:hypothetical protein